VFVEVSKYWLWRLAVEGWFMEVEVLDEDDDG